MPAPAAAQPGPSVVVGSATIGEGLTGAVVVSVREVQGLYGADVQLSFDPTVLEVQDVNPGRAGIQVRLGSFLSPDLVVRDGADNAAGTVHVAFTQVAPAEPRSGSGELFTVIFKALRASGSAEVIVAEATLANRDGMDLGATTAGGRVTVVGAQAAPPTPTAAALVEPTLVVAPAEGGSGAVGAPRATAPPAAASGAAAPPATAGEGAPPGSGRAAPVATSATTGSGAASASPVTDRATSDDPPAEGEDGAPGTAGAAEPGAAEPSTEGDDPPADASPGRDAAAAVEGGGAASAASGADAPGGGTLPTSLPSPAWLVVVALLLVAGIAVLTRRS